MPVTRTEWQNACLGNRVNWAGTSADNQTVGQRLDGLAARVSAVEAKAKALQASFDAAVLRLDAAVTAMNLLADGLDARIEAAVVEALEDQLPPPGVSPALLTELGGPLLTEAGGKLLLER